MLLSRLVYEIVKNVKYLNDPNFVYEAFKSGEFNADTDYANNITNVLSPLNEAIHRLSDRNKIRNVVESVELNENNEIDIKTLTHKPKYVVSVGYITKGEIEKIAFRDLGETILINKKVPKGSLKIEYKIDIPNILDIDFTQEENDFELNDLGINETMCSYIIEYCKGLLFENIDPGMANMHRTIAEQYFSDLEEQQVALTQRKVRTIKYGVF